MSEGAFPIPRDQDVLSYKQFPIHLPRRVVVILCALPVRRAQDVILFVLTVSHPPGPGGADSLVEPQYDSPKPHYPSRITHYTFYLYPFTLRYDTMDY